MIIHVIIIHFSSWYSMHSLCHRNKFKITIIAAKQTATYNKQNSYHKSTNKHKHNFKLISISNQIILFISKGTERKSRGTTIRQIEKKKQCKKCTHAVCCSALAINWLTDNASYRPHYSYIICINKSISPSDYWRWFMSYTCTRLCYIDHLHRHICCWMLFESIDTTRMAIAENPLVSQSIVIEQLASKRWLRFANRIR